MTAKKRIVEEESYDAHRIHVLISLSRASFDVTLEELDSSFDGIKIERIGNWCPPAD